jgi:hypothetical protein
MNVSRQRVKASSYPAAARGPKTGLEEINGDLLEADLN